jgi:hypothetical protein
MIYRNGSVWKPSVGILNQSPIYFYLYNQFHLGETFMISLDFLFELHLNYKIERIDAKVKNKNSAKNLYCRPGIDREINFLIVWNLKQSDR